MNAFISFLVICLVSMDVNILALNDAIRQFRPSDSREPRLDASSLTDFEGNHLHRHDGRHQHRGEDTREQPSKFDIPTEIYTLDKHSSKLTMNDGGENEIDEFVIDEFDPDTVTVTPRASNSEMGGFIIHRSRTDDTKVKTDASSDTNIQLNDLAEETVPPIQNVDNVQLSELTDTTVEPSSMPSDDEDADVEDDLMLGSGSGSDEKLAIEDATGQFNTTSEEDDWFLDEAHGENITEGIDIGMPPYCEEQQNSSWATWSPWLQFGDRDFRFRSCHSNRERETIETICKGDSYEVRQCHRTDERMCRVTENIVTEEFKMSCKGIHLDDIEKTDYLRAPFDRHDDCEYTLYDMKYKMAIGKSLTTSQLLRADPQLWCFSTDTYMPFYTPKQRCINQLRAFCKDAMVCEYERKDSDHSDRKLGLKKLCWRQSVLDGLFPDGIPVSKNQQLICQRYDKESKLGNMFGSKDVHYGTLYDVSLRMPFVSMAKVKFLDDDKWPDVPLMVERSLIREDSSSLISWIFKDKKKGMTPVNELMSMCNIPTCKFGENQALPSDYDHSGYSPMPLLPPGLLGSNLASRIAAFAITNVVAMEPTVLTYWKRTVNIVKQAVLNNCSTEDNLLDAYFLAGAATPIDRVEVIANDVTVPEVVWLAACCVHNDGLSSIGIYTYNQYGQTPTIVSLNNLYLLLQSLYYSTTEAVNVNLFPAFDRACSAPENDMSPYIDL